MVGVVIDGKHEEIMGKCGGKSIGSEGRTVSLKEGRDIRIKESRQTCRDGKLDR